VVTDSFYFSVVSLAHRFLVIDWTWPGFNYVVANSALVSVLMTWAYALVRRIRRAVA
jgi:hypothetical protein